MGLKSSSVHSLPSNMFTNNDLLWMPSMYTGAKGKRWVSQRSTVKTNCTEPQAIIGMNTFMEWNREFWDHGLSLGVNGPKTHSSGTEEYNHLQNPKLFQIKLEQRKETLNEGEMSEVGKGEAWIKQGVGVTAKWRRTWDWRGHGSGEAYYCHSTKGKWQ